MKIKISEGVYKLDDLKGLSEKVHQMIETRAKNNSDKKIELQVGIGKSLISKELSYSLEKYYSNPEILLEFQLKWKLLHMKNFQDDVKIRPFFGIDYGPALEASLFGVKTKIKKNDEPSIGPPILNKEEDLARLKIPSFYDSGVMPRMHWLYEEVLNLVQKNKLNFEVKFPGWARGPWSIAWMLRGAERLLMDLYERPKFVHDLMKFITESRIKWEKERLKYLDLSTKNKDYFWSYCYLDYRSPNNTVLYNDEVDGNIFSPEMYEEFILPYEKELNDFYEGTYYYHSCGKLDLYLDYINKELHPEIIHVSPWTDEKIAKNKIDNDIIIQRSLHPETEVLKADKKKIEEVLTKTIKTFRNYKLKICADAFYSGKIPDIKKWFSEAKNIISESL